MIIGSSHFKTFAAAVRYYRDYRLHEPDVQLKIDSGEIHIGEPNLKPNEKIVYIKDGRYFIES